MIFCQPTKSDLQPPLGIKNFLGSGRGFFAFYGLYFRDRYDKRLRELLLCGLTDDPLACSSKEEPAFFVGVHIAGDIVIILTGCVMYFTPAVIVIGAVFIYDLGFRLFRAPQFYDVDIFVSGKLNENFVVCLMNDRGGVSIDIFFDAGNDTVCNIESIAKNKLSKCM